MTTSTHSEKLFLLDAYAIIFRAYYAFIKNPLVNSKGLNVSAISGFTTTLFDLIQREKPTHLAVVFDLGGSVEREAEYAEYKANRQETPEDILLAVPYIKEIIRAWHIPILELEGYEADDIIGTIAKQKAAEGHTVYMVTPDKDYAQLVDEKIYIYKPSRSGEGAEIIGIPEVKRDWEVEHPQQVIDILGLWGDAVDNIPGIPGIGEKTAKKLIKEYGSLEEVIAHADNIKGKLGENIKQYAQQGLLSKKLAAINTRVPIEVSDDDLKVDEPDKEKLASIFAELEFRTLGKRILGESYSPNRPQNAPSGETTVTPANPQGLLFDLPVSPGPAVSGRNIHNTPHQYHIVQSDEDVEQLIAALQSCSEFCFDTETSGLNYFTMEIVGMSFCIKPHEAYYVPVPADEKTAHRRIRQFKDILENNNILKIGQNIKFDMLALRRYGVYVSLPVFDTMLAHYVWEPELKHGMDYMSETYLGYTPIPIEDLIGKKGKRQGNMRDVPLQQIAEYAAEDADITLQLKHYLAPLLKKREADKVLEKIEHPLVPVLADMEYEGVKIDADFLRNYSLELEKELSAVRDEIFRLAGVSFNPDSPKQLADVLYRHLKLPFEGKKTSTGQLSTNEETLKSLIKHHPIIEKILDYREIAKLKSTYVDALPEMINPVTGRVHTSFRQHVTATGRLASDNPNLQNIPIRTERGRKVREAFIPRDADHVILSADYSQIELRLVAELSGDENMLDAFDKKIDIHTATASRVYGVPLEKVTKEMRYKAKSVNFGIIYGQGAFGLAENLGISRTEAKEIIENYFRQFPKIKEYMNRNIQFAREHGYVQTMMGRRRYLKDINSKNFTVRGFAERNAINSPVQGSAADLIKLAMINIHGEFSRRKLKSKMTLQVHDELVFDAHRDELEIIKPIIYEKMTTAIKTRVPIEAEIGIGKNWLEAH
ncbi:MAG: DNA polymerase I [Chitinophagales bacterium]|nr:DNA polymerase I [Chitinophagales bacterium]MDW8418032.1 DNA polymerase I [Chitinophagales bacterium]